MESLGDWKTNPYDMRSYSKNCWWCHLGLAIITRRKLVHYYHPLLLVDCNSQWDKYTFPMDKLQHMVAMDKFLLVYMLYQGIQLHPLHLLLWLTIILVIVTFLDPHPFWSHNIISSKLGTWNQWFLQEHEKQWVGKYIISIL